MNRFIPFFFGIIALLFFSVSGFSTPETLYVSSNGATLKADKSSSSKTVKDLKLGEELKVIGFENRWYSVKTKDSKTGWIYRGKVSEEKPEITEEEQSGGLGGLLDNVADSSIEANAADTSRSIRGLSPEAEEYAKQTGKSEDFKNALDSVLERKVSKNDIENLLKNGKIGEYAE